MLIGDLSVADKTSEANIPLLGRRGFGLIIFPSKKELIRSGGVSRRHPGDVDIAPP